MFVCVKPLRIDGNNKWNCISYEKFYIEVARLNGDEVFLCEIL